jgi:hypothetical protein
MEHWNNGFCEARAEVYRQNPIGRTLLTKNLIIERLPHKIIIFTPLNKKLEMPIFIDHLK